MNSREMLSDEQVVLYFRKLKSELNCSSTPRLITLVRQVLLKVKDLNPGIISKIPPLLHMVLAGGSSTNLADKRSQHLDRLAEMLYSEDRQMGVRFFKSELDALHVVLVILRRLQDMFEGVRMEIFPHVLSTEVKQAAMEEAA